MNTINPINTLIHEIYQPKLAFAGIIGNAVLALLVSIVFYNYTVPLGIILSWLLPMLTILSVRSVKVIRYNNKYTTEIADEKKSKKWLLFYQVGVFITGLLWGLSVHLFSNHIDNPIFYMFMTALIFGHAAAGIAILSIIFRVFASMVIPMFSLLIYALLNSNEVLNFEAGLFAIAGMLYMLYTSYKHSTKSHELVKRTLEVEDTQLEIIKRLAKAGEYRDNETGLHVSRMSHSSYLLALENDFSDADATRLLLAAPMHDIGKIGIPDSVLLKPGKLSKEEWVIMKTHTTIGENVLSNSKSELLNLSAVIAGNHHEKWDGSGYPRGLSKQEIPLEARIVTVCDVFDALTSERPYKEAWSEKDAISFIKKESGKQFDPEQVKKFLTILPKVLQFNEQLNLDANMSGNTLNYA